MLENSAVNVLKIRCKHLKNVFKFCDALVCFNFSKTKFQVTLHAKMAKMIQKMFNSNN